MIRTQIQLTEEQSRGVREAARRSGVSTAEVIRRSVDRFLEQEAAPSVASTRMSALEIVGRFSCGLSDIADRHDDYLEEAYSAIADSDQ
ncbi:MAG: ribbon-helix-helix protein, CopG family [Thermoleophilia bacterium]|nr:ribbon-helix-helix protein, CopG family [Thermoleophilia bacterium]